MPAARGLVIRPRRIDPQMCRNHPNDAFLFGDNLQRRGKAGQAVIRDEPNAVGIPTKRRPSMLPGSFFEEGDYLEVIPLIDNAMLGVIGLPREGRSVWIPADGIGTGMARLPLLAPSIHAHIDDWIKALEREWGSIPA